MSDHMKHTAQFHINEETRTAKGSLQWFLTRPNLRGRKPPPITHNNKVQVFVCGEEGFADISAEIQRAEKSIQMCCWGFDPGMELVRDPNKTQWPRGPTFGDLLIAAGKRDVHVEVLVWLHAPLTATSIYYNEFNPKNLPGWTHDTYYFNNSISQDKVGDIDSLKILAAHRAEYIKGEKKSAKQLGPADEAGIARTARRQYCIDWFRAARGLDGRLANVTVIPRKASGADIERSLGGEAFPPTSTERDTMVQIGSHHQKTILIDYDFERGKKAVGYVMGLNSVTGYWDTTEHQIEDYRRERGGEIEKKEAVQPLRADSASSKNAKAVPAPEPDPGFSTQKPYQDYACRVEGAALISVRSNFAIAWLRASIEPSASRDLIQRDLEAEQPPALLLGPRKPGDATVQIVRTQPEDEDTTIKEIYFQATDNAVITGGYVYVENQYFQYEEWAQRLVKKRQAQAELWNSARKKSNRSMEDLPILHVFIVAPIAERSQMVPSTYDTLAVVGQHEGMYGQHEFIETVNEALPEFLLPGVAKHANGISKPTLDLLENKMGLKVATAMLQVSGRCHDLQGKRRMRYREIYIHSKLLLVNDGFFTLGSANLNQRSMAGDSEINLATNEPRLARDLRKRVWSQLSGTTIDGGSGSRDEISESFKNWGYTMKENKQRKRNAVTMVGFLLPFEDNRSSFVRFA